MRTVQALGHVGGQRVLQRHQTRNLAANVASESPMGQVLAADGGRVAHHDGGHGDARSRLLRGAQVAQELGLAAAARAAAPAAAAAAAGAAAARCSASGSTASKACLNSSQ